MNVMLVSGLVFVGTLAVIFSEKLNRTIAAIVGAVVMVGIGLYMDFYSEEAAIESIDFQTIGLLLGMMIMVALLQPTGFFQYVAAQAGRMSGGSPWKLMVLLGVVTTLLSMFLDNVTTIVLIAPVTILICEILGFSPIPYLIAQTILSNTGGTGTLVGDPPNVLIGSAANLSFNSFLTNALPIVVVVWFITIGLLMYLFRNDLREHSGKASVLEKLDPERALDDPASARKVLIVLGAALGLFFVHHLLHLSPSYIALAASAAALIWVRPSMHELLERLEWSVLLFFAALFVMVGGLESSGLLHETADVLAGFGNLHPIWLGVGLIWAVAILSSIVDNIPITAALIPVIQGLETTSIDTYPLWWALVLGAGLGGNGTVIGSSANMIVVSLTERARIPISFFTWSRYGMPVMLVSCFVASLLFVLMFHVLGQ